MRSRHRLFAASLVVLLAACGGSGSAARGPAPSGVVASTPAAAVELFLGFAKQERYTEMGHLFGTARGPLAERRPPLRVAQQMQALATLLRHDTFSLAGVMPGVGRPEARQVMVQLRTGGRVVDIPFLVVQGPGGRWLVEMVDTDAAQQPRRAG